MRWQKGIVVGGIVWFVLCSFVLYWYAPSCVAHFEGDSLRYDVLARLFPFINCIPLEVLGYPFFIACVYWLSGVQLWLLVTAQVLLSIGFLLIARRIARIIFGEQAALLLVFLWAFNLGFLIYSQLVLIEILYAFLLIVFVERMVMCILRPTVWLAAQAAFVLGVSVLVRPAALFFAPICVLLLLIIPQKRFVERIVHSLLFLIIFYTPITLYMSANYFFFGQFVLCPVMNVNLFKFFYPKLVVAFTAAGVAVPAQLHQDITHAMTTQVFDRVVQMRLLQVVLVAPWIAIKIWIVNMAKSMFGLYSVEWKLYFGFLKTSRSFFIIDASFPGRVHTYICSGASHWWLWVIGYYELVYLLVQYSAACVGWYILSRRQLVLAVFSFVFIGYFAWVTGPDGSGRFRMMLEPWLLVLAAGGASLLSDLMQRRRV